VVIAFVASAGFAFCLQTSFIAPALRPYITLLPPWNSIALTTCTLALTTLLLAVLTRASKFAGIVFFRAEAILVALSTSATLGMSPPAGLLLFVALERLATFYVLRDLRVCCSFFLFC
jgi:hypothetical protein